MWVYRQTLPEVDNYFIFPQPVPESIMEFLGVLETNETEIQALTEQVYTMFISGRRERPCSIAVITP